MRILLVTVLLLGYSASIALAERKLLYLFELTRHGARTPIPVSSDYNVTH